MSDFLIPFGGRSHTYTDGEIDEVKRMMQGSMALTQGEEQDRFQKRFSKFLGVENAFAVSNATAGLELIAQLCQFHSGDEVVIPAHTFTSSAYPFVKHGASIVWADIDLNTRVTDASLLEPCITNKTKAIVVPHLYGYGADMPEIMELAARYDLIVIEDVAQAIGVKVGEKMAGAYGDFSVFSLHAQKNISTLGEGGVLVTRDKEFSRLIPMIRHNGHCGFTSQRNDYWLPAMGDVDLPELNSELIWPNNFCLGEIQCALGVKLLDRVVELNQEKRHRALQFIDAFVDHPEIEFHREDSDRHNYHLLVARLAVGNRDDFIRLMAREHRIQCVVQYYPLYRYPFYKKLGFGSARCSNTDKFFDSMISFPFHHSLDNSQLDQIRSAAINVLSRVSAGN